MTELADNVMNDEFGARTTVYLLFVTAERPVSMLHWRISSHLHRHNVRVHTLNLNDFREKNSIDLSSIIRLQITCCRRPDADVQ